MAIHGIMRGGTVDPLVGASLTVTGTSALGGQVDFTGVQTDTSVGTQDDFALQSGVTVLRANPASTVTYDGFAGGVAGRVLFIINTSANLVNLNNEAAGSTAANRILGQVGSNCTLNGAGANANSNALLIYDGVSSRWRVIATNTNVFNSGMSFSAATTFNSSVRTNSVLTPAAASGSTNDVAGGSTANVIRQDVSSAAVFTGLVAQTAGQTVTLTNIATAPGLTLTLTHEDALSSAANRFTLPNGQPFELSPGGSITLRYDGTSSRWRPTSLPTAAQVPKRIGSWVIDGIQVAIGGSGIMIPTVLGSITSRTPASTNLLTSMIRVGWVSAAGANSIAGLYNSSFNSVHQFWRGNAAGLGGFYWKFRFAVSDAVLVSTANMFVGLHNQASIPVDGLPSALTNLIGVGCDSGDTNLQLYASGAVAQTRVDLGASFPVNTINTDIYELVLFAPPNASYINYQVTRVNTGNTASGQISVAANLFANTMFVGPRMWRSNGATAAAVGIDAIAAYVETEN